MEAQHRNPPAVLLGGIDVHVVLVAGEHLAKAAHANEGPRVLAYRLLELTPEPRRIPRAIGKDREAAAAFESVSADEPRLLVLEVAEARHVEPARPAVIERRGPADQLLDQARRARPHHVFAEVVADVAARVADAVGVLS